MFNNSYLTVKNKDILTIKLQNYKDIEDLEVYDDTSNSWLPCKLKKFNRIFYEVLIQNNKDSNTQKGSIIEEVN